MSNQRWIRIWELFHTALERPAGERRSWLAGQDEAPSIREEVAALLKAHSIDRQPIDDPPFAIAGLQEPQPGDRIDRYRVLALLGHGGMGRVYLVERDDGAFRKRAALKLIDPLLAEPRLLDALARERDLLARLEHPNIARLLDGGQDAFGRPFLVMEYVDGMAIDRWCRERMSGWFDRVVLFSAICDAVGFAHRQLIVHRDLKPGNILVTAAGVPVLLDFGIARALDPNDDVTLFGERPALTPRYASPEQLRGEPVGTAGDIYSLGVLLYELLAGSAPNDPAGRSWREFAIELGKRPWPDLRAAARRGCGDRLPAEFDWICRTAMAPEPEQRYRSADALAQDLRAVLAHRPTSARPTSAVRRLRLLLRRNRSGAVVAALVLVLSASFLWRLHLEAARTRSALEQAQIERDHAEGVAQFMQELFRTADPTRSAGQRMDAEDLLDSGRQMLAERGDLSPLNRALLLNALAAVYRNLGRYEVALELLTEARSLLPADDASGLAVDIELGFGHAQALAGNALAAEQTLARLSSDLQTRSDLEPRRQVAVLLQLGAVRQTLGDHDAAGSLFRQAHALTVDAGTNDRAEAALRLGSWHWTGGSFEQAASLYAEALALRRSQIPPDLPELARTLDASGTLEHARGRYEPARLLFEEALQLRRRILGAQHRSTADTLSHLGALHYDRGADDEAERHLHEALLAYAGAGLSEENPIVAKALNNLGLVHWRKRDLTPARALFERALAANRLAYGPGHPRIAGNLNNLALVAEAAGNLDEAEDLLVQALQIGEQALGGKHPSLGYTLTNLGRVLLWQERFDEARTFLERARDLRRRSLPDDHPAQIDTAVWLGFLYCRADAARSEGEELLRLALQRRQLELTADDPALLRLNTKIAMCTTPSRPDAQAREHLHGLRNRLAATTDVHDPLLRLLNQLLAGQSKPLP